jgi:alpha-galactosidase
MHDPSRRDLLKTAASAALVTSPVGSIASVMEPVGSFVTLLREPDLVRAFDGKNEEIRLDRSGNRWAGGGAEIEVTVQGDHVALTMRGTGVSRIQLRWRGDLRAVKRYLGDHWERSYADLEWRGEAPNRPMPWYFMAHDGKATHGYGVRTGAGALCFWMADSEGISLWADVRSGGVPVELGGRTLNVAEIVCRQGKGGENAFASTRAFCLQMCANPRLPDKPVYGTNDWNYAYGNSSAELIASVSGLISELSPDADNRPYSVIDEGWQMGPYEGRFGYGPWVGNPRFGDMAAFATRLKGMGVRPGLWFRPLTPLADTPQSWMLSRNKETLDPTIPEVKEHVASHIRRFVDWGYEMIKHDFSSWDILGQWGSQMGPNPTRDGWRLHDASKTNAEVMTDLYRTIREAAGSARLIGCNTMSHLAAGFHEIQRIGDDTSGRSWNRNRRMGINTLAFRAPQHRAFYEVDPDIVSITKAVPWSLVEQWLRLVSESGTALFVAVEPSVVEPKHREALKKALSIAAKPQPVGEPLDWMETVCPRRWRLLGKTTEFAWMGESGGWPFPD